MILQALLLCLVGLWADESSAAPGTPSSSPPRDASSTGPLPGHSLHGEVFNEGPRQRGELLPGMGAVTFPITCGDPQVQAFFNQGVAQFHGFLFLEAERSFRQAASLEPGCAMPYFGMALANLRNRPRAKGFIAMARERQELATPREALWIKALADYLEAPDDLASGDRWRRLVQGLEALLYEYPDEIEGKALLAFVLWEASGEGLPMNSHQAVDALLAQVLAVAPEHPGAHHYVIHLWDKEKAERGLTSAARLGPSAPGIAHQWHMPGHIYDRLLRFADAAWQQEASARVDHAYMHARRVLPYEIHNYAHNQEWLIRSRIHCGQSRAALAAARGLLETPRHPLHNAADKPTGCAAYGRDRLIDALLAFELWPQLLELSETPWLPPTEDRARRIAWLKGRAAACWFRNQSASARQQRDELRSLLAAQRGEQEVAGKAAEDKARSEMKSEAEAAAARDAARQPFDDLAGKLEAAVSDVEALDQAFSGDAAAADALDKSQWPKTMIAQVHLRHGRFEAAEKAARDAVEASRGQVLPLAALVESLAAAGKTEEAQLQFSELRTLAADADLDAPPLARLGRLAQSWGHAADWRLPRPVASDLGARPELDSLGPSDWEPWAAPGWKARDASGQEVASTEFDGRPTLVLGYLGFGCLHCVEQLKAFAPLAAEFQRAGIRLVGVGTDPPPALAASLAKYEQESGAAFPFPLLADESQAAFRAWGAYDDFERQPLHVTLLVDAGGRVRWQAIGHEPFSDATFLLAEARRLLDAEFSRPWPEPR